MRKKFIILLTFISLILFSSTAIAGENGHVPPEPIRDSVIDGQ